MKQSINKIEVIGQRWFDKINGNTYCAAKVYINNELVLTTDYQYGYDEHYLTVAKDALEKQGILETGRTPLWRYCREKLIDFEYTVRDGLKRDLKTFSQGGI